LGQVWRRNRHRGYRYVEVMELREDGRVEVMGLERHKGYWLPTADRSRIAARRLLGGQEYTLLMGQPR
jgi:hypothetical protein